MSDCLIECSLCHQKKESSAFYPRSERPGQFHTLCKPCGVEKQRKWRQANPGSRNKEVRRFTLLKVHNLTQEQYNGLLESQNGLCAICKLPQANIRIKNLCVAHDHTTQKVRGLLCGNCNRALGLFRDDPNILKEAAYYLESQVLK